MAKAAWKMAKNEIGRRGMKAKKENEE